MTDDPLIQPEEVHDQFQRGRSWSDRFSVAVRGIKIAFRAEVNFFVHLFVAAVALLAGTVLSISRWEWCLVVLCIAVALSAELFNTSIERIARAITREENSDIRDSLDIASGAVLVVALGAVILGLMVFGVHIAEVLSS